MAQNKLQVPREFLPIMVGQWVTLQRGPGSASAWILDFIKGDVASLRHPKRPEGNMEVDVNLICFPESYSSLGGLEPAKARALQVHQKRQRTKMRLEAAAAEERSEVEREWQRYIGYLEQQLELAKAARSAATKLRKSIGVDVADTVDQPRPPKFE